MNRHTVLLIAFTAVLVESATPALATTADQPHPTHERTQVLHLRVTPVSFIDTFPGYVAIDDDFDLNGAKVGSDVTTCRPVPGDNSTARCDVGLGLAGGLITITFTESDTSTTAYGRVTSGTGAYTGVRGPVVINEGADGADVTLTLHR